MRILWIEDKEHHIKRFVELLRADGDEVTLAASGEATLEAVEEAKQKSEPYDVVLLDVMMPKGEGKRIDPTVRPELMGEEVLRQMARPEIRWPVVGISAIVDQEFRNRVCDKYDFVKEFLKKPIKMDELRNAISKAVKTQ